MSGISTKEHLADTGLGGGTTGTRVTTRDGRTKRGLDVTLQQDADSPAVASNILYSDYQATLADTAEIDSGWLDCNNVDKLQFSGFASVAGMTMTIESRADDSQTPLSTPVTYNDGAFYMFNVICRQRYMRFMWTNNTGGGVTNVSMEIKASYGSSDKLSVFPVGVNPTVFSQAALTQSIIRGRQPDGDYVAIPADGAAFSEDESLGADGVFLSPWTDSDGWNSIEVFVTTDAISAFGGIEIEFTDDVQDATPTVRATKTYNFSEQDIVDGFKVIRVPTILDGYRVRYTNGSTAQSNLYIESALRTNAENIRFNDGGALLVSDFKTEVAQEKVSNYSINTKFGRNPDSDTGTTPETIWNLGGVYNGYPSAASIVEINSSSGNDTSAGTGARTLTVKGLDSDFNPIEETVTLNGTTRVNTVNSYIRLFRAYIESAGSGGTNAGDINVRQVDDTSVVFAGVPTGTGQSTVAADTVPNGKKRIILGLYSAITRANGSAGSANHQFRIKEEGKPFRAVRNIDISTSFAYQQQSYIVLPAKTDMEWTVTFISDNNTISTGEFEYIDIDV